MAFDVSGTLLKFTIEGQSFRLAADVNLTKILSTFANEMVPSSGEAMLKKTKRIPTGEGFVLLVNSEEAEDLKTFADSLTDLKISYTNAAGDEFKCEGAIEFENLESEESRATIQVHPRTTWTPIIAS
jgi:hypothetical protein